MNRPKRSRSHVLEEKSDKYFRICIPDEWIINQPSADYGLDYNIGIVINEMVTGLNFSVQVKASERFEHPEFAKVALETTTLNYYMVRLEPTMLIFYDVEVKKAYWSWITDFDIDLSNGNKTHTLSISKSNKFSEIDWTEIASYVQKIFNQKSFIDDFDLRKIENNLELGAWKSFYENNYEQAIFLFRKLIEEGNRDFNVFQALAWSQYCCFQYRDALNTINLVLDNCDNTESRKTKACILNEYGNQKGDKGMIIQARDLFKKFLTGDDGALMLYNYGNTFYALEDYKNARKQFLLSLEKYPNNAQCWKNLGTTYYHSGEHEKEIECYDHALKIQPRLQQALFSKGVTYAQIYNKYTEALELFHQVLDYDNNLPEMYVNGLFWVAYSYQELGQLKKALYWVDKGLNYEGTNLFLLNFKSNLLVQNWKTVEEWKDKAIEFCEYRIELDNDSTSLFHLIKIKEYNLAQALDFLRDKHPLYKRITEDHFGILGLGLEDLLDTLRHLDLYTAFRKNYLTTRYLDHLIVPDFSISVEFFELLDFIFAVAFNRGASFAAQFGEEIQTGRNHVITLVNHMPLLVPYLVPSEDFNDEAISRIMSSNQTGFITMIYREIGAALGIIIHHFQLRDAEESKYITPEIRTALSDGVFEAYCGRLGIEDAND